MEYKYKLDFNKYIAEQMSKSKGYSTKAIIHAYLRDIFLLHEADKISTKEYLSRNHEVEDYYISMHLDIESED